MTAPAPPLDEIVFARPDIAQWWMDGEGGLMPGPHTWMEERLIHRYFTESPFFDPTTKNGTLWGQVEKSVDLYRLYHDRAALEAALARSKGPEYVIAYGPQAVTDKGVPPGQKSNIWVLRRQERLEAKDKSLSSTELRGTYYIVNESIYQAPSVADVVGNRMLSAIMSLEKMWEKAATLPTFSPTTGHTYLPVTSNKGTASTAASRAGSPNRSRSASLAPGPMDTQSLRSGSVPADGSQIGGSNTSDDVLATRLLVDSLRQTATYGDEFMDENPLLGEPGNFKFTASTAAIKKRRADDEATERKAQEMKEAKEKAIASRAGSTSPKPAATVKAPTPPPVFTEARATAKMDKDKKEERKRRRKSKHGGTATSPATPRSATSAMPSSVG
ncbi:Mediator of RNA polymerase II transcription subunit 6 [Elasticomyces elasticus]|nr:Mediator of RNA polymerase II transcription subunit 6 [Elasticomyces elasticus]